MLVPGKEPKKLPNPVNSGSVNFSYVWIFMRKFSPTPSIGILMRQQTRFWKGFLDVFKCNPWPITHSLQLHHSLSVTGLIWEASWRQGIHLSDLNQSVIRSFDRPQTCSRNMLQKYNQPSTIDNQLFDWVSNRIQFQLNQSTTKEAYRVASKYGLGGLLQMLLLAVVQNGLIHKKW